MLCLATRYSAVYLNCATYDRSFVERDFRDVVHAQEKFLSSCCCSGSCGKSRGADSLAAATRRGVAASACVRVESELSVRRGVYLRNEKMLSRLGGGQAIGCKGKSSKSEP